MLAFVLTFLKGLLVPRHDKLPTAEEIQAFEEAEDERGFYGAYPSPMEAYLDSVEWRDGMIELPLRTLIRWRLAVAWMPFCETERRLVGEWASRKLFPDLYTQRRKLALAKRKAAA